jgi:general secretion pathway protein D
MVIDERLGIIILRDTPEAIRMAERIVALHDLSDPEVMLEVEIMEIKRTRLLELGIHWPSQLSLAPLQTSGQALTLEALKNLSSSTIQATTGSMIFNARKEDQDADILANPRIRVRNKDKAKIQIGDRVPVITTTSTSTGFVSESVNYVDVGLKLEVEPTIYLDREVAIKINLEVSNLVREITSKSGTLSYQIGTRGANTVLRLKDGETQILAGLISDEDRSNANKVPGLGELPIAGRLFGSKKDETQRSEILLSITPRIVRSIQRPDMLEAEFESGTESAIGAQTLRLTAVEPTAVEAKDAAGTSAPTPVQSSGSVSLTWQAPAQVKTGEQFSAVIQLASQAAIRGMPVLLSFDTQLLQVMGVQEGTYFTQNYGLTTFSHRIDPAQGKVYVALVRQGFGGEESSGVNGSGSLLTVNFKSLKPGLAKIQVLSANPEPALASPITTPIETSVRVVP